MLAPKQIRRLDSLVAAKRARHVELRRPITSAGLRAVLRREGVLVKVLPHPRDAELLAIEGRWAIIVNEAQPHAERLVAVAHEYGHYIAHVDPKEPRTYDASPPWYDAMREAEADYLAEMLVRGPTSCPPPFARRGRADTRRADPDQLALQVTFSSDLPAVGKSHRVGKRQRESVPAQENSAVTAKLPHGGNEAIRARDARAHERRIVKRGAKRLAARVTDRLTPDDDRIEWGNGTRPTRYVEPDGHRWTIYNARVAIVDGRAQLELVHDFMDRRATHRIFVDSAGQRRVYRFVPRELRAYKVKHLERQLASATPPRRPSFSGARPNAELVP